MSYVRTQLKRVIKVRWTRLFVTPARLPLPRWQAPTKRAGGASPERRWNTLIYRRLFQPAPHHLSAPVGTRDTHRPHSRSSSDAGKQGGAGGEPRGHTSWQANWERACHTVFIILHRHLSTSTLLHVRFYIVTMISLVVSRLTCQYIYTINI